MYPPPPLPPLPSSSRPQDIMGEIYKKLKSLGFEWKIVNSYHIIVRQRNEQGVTIKVGHTHTHTHTHTTYSTVHSFALKEPSSMAPVPTDPVLCRTLHTSLFSVSLSPGRMYIGVECPEYGDDCGGRGRGRGSS